MINRILTGALSLSLLSFLAPALCNPIAQSGPLAPDPNIPDGYQVGMATLSRPFPIPSPPIPSPPSLPIPHPPDNRLTPPPARQRAPQPTKHLHHQLPPPPPLRHHRRPFAPPRRRLRRRHRPLPRRRRRRLRPVRLVLQHHHGGDAVLQPRPL